MTQRTLASLVALNVMLLAMLVLVVLTPNPAVAQFGGGGNKYLMLAGQSPQREQQSMIYIIDVNTSQMIALMVNTSNSTVDYVAGTRVSEDLQGATGGGGRGGR